MTGIPQAWALLILALSLAAPAAAHDSSMPPSADTKPARITDKSHPDYVRCRSEEVIGSRANTRRICKTNREWAELSAKGDPNSRDMLNRAAGLGGLTPQ